MQKLLLIVSLFFLLPASFAHAGIAQPPTTRGLVGYWSMEDCKLTKATDNSGQGNTGTLTNFALTGAASNWVAGKLGACALNFDGSNDYVDTGLLVSPAQYPSLTISAWVKLTAQTGGFKPIVAADNGGFDRAFGVDPGSSTRYSIQVGNTAWTPVAYTTGVWQHVVVVYTSSSITFYLNGVAYSYGSGGTFGTSNQGLLIGADIPCGVACRINGSIDDVRVYNRALTGNEIARLYGGGASHAKPATTRGLVGHWSFEDCKLNKASDDSGRGNTGTLTNFALTGATSNWVAGKRGACALDFDGTDDYVNLSDSYDIGTQNMTVSVWFKTTDTDFSLITKSIYGNGARWGVGVNESGAGIYSFLANGTPILTPTISGKSDGQWHHLVAVFNRAANLSQYLDGTFQNSVSIAALNGVDIQSSYYTFIGLYQDAATGQSPHATVLKLAGSIDDVRIYNRALSANEITDLYASSATRYNASTTTLQAGTSLASGLVGHWTFDGANLTTTKAKDSTTNLNHGTLTGANGLPRPVMGQLGQALKFDGVDDYVQSSVFATIPSSITMSAWVNPTATGGVVLSERGTGGTWHDSQLEVQTNGTVKACMWVGSISCVTAGSGLSYNQWHHIVMRYNVTGTTLTGFMDGVQGSSVVGTKQWPASGLFYTMGQSDITNGGNGVAFSGSIDDVRVYNRALSDAEVLQLYNLGR